MKTDASSDPHGWHTIVLRAIKIAFTWFRRELRLAVGIDDSEVTDAPRS